MGKVKAVELNRAQRTALEKTYRDSECHAFRVRCKMILLKSEQRTTAEVAGVLGCCEVVVNNWLKRFQAQGIEGYGRKRVEGASRFWMLRTMSHESKLRSLLIANA